MVANSAAAAADNYNTGGFRIPPLPSAGVETMPVETSAGVEPIRQQITTLPDTYAMLNPSPLPVQLKQYLDPITNPTWPSAYTSTGFQQATPAPPAGLPPLSALFGPPGPPPAPTHRQMHDADSADELDFFECFD